MNYTEIYNALIKQIGDFADDYINQFMFETFSYDDTIDANCIEQVYEDFDHWMGELAGF